MQEKQRIKSILIGLAIAGFFLWFQTTKYDQIVNVRQRLELLAYDVRLKATLPDVKPCDQKTGCEQIINSDKSIVRDKRVVIVDIDEKSLRREGRWPWSRAKMAVLLDQLFANGAIVVGFDIMFSEPERNSAEEVLNKLSKELPASSPVIRTLKNKLSDFDNDLRFSEILRNKDVVLGYIFHREQHPPIGKLPLPANIENRPAVMQSTVTHMNSYTASLPKLQSAARFGGFFSLDADPDGILRRVPLLVKYKDKIYPSLALETARIYQLIDKFTVHTEDISNVTNVTGIELTRGKVIPTDGEGRVIIPFIGQSKSYLYLSATDVISGKFPKEHLKNTIVFIGTTAEGLFDLRAAPMQGVYPGVEIHANLISGILDNKFPVEPPWASGANFTLLVVSGVLLVFVLPFLNPYYKIAFTLLAVATIAGSNIWLWTEKGLVLAMALPLLLVITLSAVNLAYGFLTEAESKSQLQDMFGQYIPRELVAEMTENPRHYGFEGVSREMTVLFADICQFTTISEQLTASKLKELLNRFFTPMTRIIFDNRGTIDKYVGDMLMAFWGAPVINEQHAVHSLDAAFGMLEEVQKLKRDFEAEGLPPFEIGIGINSGVMNVGDMGSEYRRAYTVIGDTVNIASRLEGLTRFYDVPLVIGEKTYELVADSYACLELDLVQVKGASRPIKVYQPLCRLEHMTASLKQELELLHQAYRLYRIQEWKKANALFEQLMVHHERPLYSIYLERIDWFRRDPPGPSWNGVFERRTK
ncbi:MAG: adenylate/guanylate cyclase domain-containing protein [Gammaproteobacteria bacterium]|nr:adenylate/guanylate cyclase domain-containing protein [Gammaproteobacteria bacterium]MDH5652687.1 adenylate/guanylate cyclase domain-containing protein [Gammaproteobacteria bacterium]